jgi:hypothetical protein
MATRSGCLYAQAFVAIVDGYRHLLSSESVANPLQILSKRMKEGGESEVEEA